MSPNHRQRMIDRDGRIRELLRELRDIEARLEGLRAGLRRMVRNELGMGAD